MPPNPLTTVKALDHLVLTCNSIPATIHWYTSYLGMRSQAFVSPLNPLIQRHALLFGHQKINLHQRGAEFEPKATTALPGTADLCFLVEDGTSLQSAIEGFRKDGIEVLEGEKVVLRTGARGKISSVYVRDPDGNLIELSKYST
ncbi:Glyoxalase/Bleomycin resistance protein/Dihydroxybiphenyl dioxygenase [Bisporella sp. PMI_857]|nr:Glyoxalase/Bleomycin resistance protein/Dihydroxybiphenyl dioxygenase [Bisporella sp. PMI_857]